MARELTKLHEEVRRGSWRDLAAHYAKATTPKGEVTFVGGKLTVSMGEPGSGPDVAWWIYEDLKRPLMRLDASVGYDRDGAVAGLYRVGLCPTFAYVYPGGTLQEASIGELTAPQLEARVDGLLQATRAAEGS